MDSNRIVTTKSGKNSLGEDRKCLGCGVYSGQYHHPDCQYQKQEATDKGNEE